MVVLNKLTKKKWIVMIALLVIIVGGVGASAYFHHRSEFKDKANTQAYRQVCEDLLYLEQFDTLKLKPDQAKQILPLMDRMSASADTNTQRDLAKQIYGTLTAVQYETLLTSQAGTGPKYRNAPFAGKNQKYRDREDRNYRDEDRLRSDPNNLRLQAMGNVVNTMLKQRASETAPATP